MPSNTNTKIKLVVKKERVQLDFSQDAIERLDDLKTSIDAATRAETVRQALRLLEWFVNEINPDNTIEVFDKDNKSIQRFKASLLHNATKQKK